MNSELADKISTSPAWWDGEGGTEICRLPVVTKAERDEIANALRGNASINDANHYTVTEMEAIGRLVKIAMSSTGQSRRCANFLLAWWNATDNGGFDFTDLWNVDLEIAQDMLVVFALIANCRHYADHYGFEAEFRQLVTHWRQPKKAKRVGR